MSVNMQEGEKMKKHAWIAPVMLLLLLLMSPMALAGTDIGHLCWDFDQHADTLRVSATQSNSAPGVLSSGANIIDTLGVRWRGLEVYELGGAGIATPSRTPGWAWEIYLNLSHFEALFFGGQRNCMMHISLDATFHGPWFVECGTGASMFVSNGTLSPLACPAIGGIASTGTGEQAHLPLVGGER